MTDLVNDECVVTDGSMIYSFSGFGLVHTADFCDFCLSYLVHTCYSCENEGQFS